MNSADQAKPTHGKIEWWRGCAVYQVYPRSFQDTTGDGVGDLKGVVRRLPYVASLGVDAVWLSPFFKSPMADMGYDIADYCAVDPLFGAIEDFDAVVGEAHRLGLKVIIDQVLSHSSDRHEWFRESRSSRDNPKADWYVWADAKPDGTAPNNWLSVFGGPSWEWDSVRKQYYLHNFLASQPDLNFHNPEVQQAMLATLRFWLDRGVDAFRFDAVNYYFHDRSLADNPPLARTLSSDVPDTNPYGFQQHIHDKTQPENIGFLKRVRALLDSYGERMSIGEVGDGDRSLTTVAAYTDGNDKLNMCYTFDLLGPELSVAHISRCVEAFEHSRAGWVCWAFSNHDVARHISRFAKPGDDADHLAKFCVTLLCALRGSVCLYQGEELGLAEADIAFEDLRDPYGIRFWPGFRGATAAARRWSGKSRPSTPASRAASRGCPSRRSTGSARSRRSSTTRIRCWRTTARRWRSAKSIRCCLPAISALSRRRKVCLPSSVGRATARCSASSTSPASRSRSNCRRHSAMPA
jgi:alpha-glucosidase